MSKIKVKHAFMQQLLVDGIRYIFGNPGTLEEGFLDALSDFPEIQYVFGLQESVVIGMASGYARVAGKPAIVQVHTMVGLGNAMGMLYEARRGCLPLVVYAGEVSTKFTHFDGFFGGDLVEMAQPVSKWAYRVTDGSSMLQVLRRALKVAMTPPQGPVFLAIPMDVFEEEIEPDLKPTHYVDWRTTPKHEEVITMAQGLMEAKAPLILIGDEIHLSGAEDEVMKLAEQIGCPVYGGDFTYQSIYKQDSLYMDTLNLSYGKYNHPITKKADVILAIGTPLFPEMIPDTEPYFSQEARLFQIDLNPWEIGKNFPVEVGITADPKATLSAILHEVGSHLTPHFQTQASTRREHLLEQKRKNWESMQIAYDHLRSKRPMHPSHMMKIITEMLPENAIIYDESITSSPPLVHYLQWKPASYLMSHGRCLGVGWSGSIGVKLAYPHQPVLALSGDGASLYVIQSLWTASHHNLHIVFLVCNNKSYRILKRNILEYWAEEGLPVRQFPHHDLDHPAINFDKIAEGFGVKAWSANDPDSLRAALQGAFQEPGTHLINVQIESDVSEDIKMIMGDQGRE